MSPLDADFRQLSFVKFSHRTVWAMPASYTPIFASRTGMEADRG